jgi:hypothetical protein
MKLFSRSNQSKLTKQPIIIVSGLPRSGTSMMMKMLAEGGAPVLADEQRRPDDDNPNGYFELEVVRQLKQGNVHWLQQADGKVVKVISALLEYLPADHDYKVIFMERETGETLASQKKMLDHRGQEPRLTDDEMEQQLRAHLAAVKPWLARQPNMDVLYVNYNAFLTNPEPFCDQLAEFLALPLNQAHMLTVPDRRLYRNRAPGET